MNILDENIRRDQYAILRRYRFAVRQIGHEIGRSGMSDEEIIPFLRRLKQPTFFTRDRGFFQRDLRHARYCLVWLDVKKSEVAEYVRRFLRHPDFRTRAQRMDRVAAVSATGLHVWTPRAEQLARISWDR